MWSLRIVLKLLIFSVDVFTGTYPKAYENKGKSQLTILEIQKEMGQTAGASRCYAHIYRLLISSSSAISWQMFMKYKGFLTKTMITHLRIFVQTKNSILHGYIVFASTTPNSYYAGKDDVRCLQEWPELWMPQGYGA